MMGELSAGEGVMFGEFSGQWSFVICGLIHALCAER